MDLPTKKLTNVPTVLVLGEDRPPELITEIAAEVGAATRASSLALAATTAASIRPVAILLTEELYAFDRAGFEALAWDVGARIIRISGANAPVEEVRFLVQGTVWSVLRLRAKARSAEAKR